MWFYKRCFEKYISDSFQKTQLVDKEDSMPDDIQKGKMAVFKEKLGMM